jgi:hypothetical protein
LASRLGEQVARPSFNATRAIAIAASPEQVWPWLVQMGLTRAGWYSYDILDNLGRPSARRIIPELQHLTAGDLVPMSPDGKQGMGPAHRPAVGNSRATLCATRLPMSQPAITGRTRPSSSMRAATLAGGL